MLSFRARCPPPEQICPGVLRGQTQTLSVLSLLPASTRIINSLEGHLLSLDLNLCTNQVIAFDDDVVRKGPNCDLSFRFHQ